MSWLQWQQPWWLLLALAPLLLLLPRRDRSAALEQFIARHLWPRLLTLRPDRPQRRLPPLFSVAWLLACAALAGPVLQSPSSQEGVKRQADVALILDISPSMRVADIAPNRLAYSKRLLSDFAAQLKGQRVALIAFSANAYTVLPLTSDNNVLLQMIDAMDPALAGVTGSNLSRALQLAQQALSAPAVGDESAHPGVVVLVSDGGIHDQGALAASRRLHQAGHRLFTLGVGSDNGGPVPFATGRLISVNGELITSRLERPTLRALARAGGGDYSDLRPEAWPHLMSAVDAVKLPRHSASQPLQGRQLFPLLLAVALALFLWSGLRHPAVIAVALALPLSMQSPTADAAPWDEARAESLLQQGEYREALQLYVTIEGYNGRLGEGVAAYRLGLWQQALDAFSQALRLARSDSERARASYNRGNALVQMGQLDEAVAAYKRTLFWQPGDANANHNLTLLQQQQAKGGERKGKSDYQRQGDGGELEKERPTSAAQDGSQDNNQKSNRDHKPGENKGDNSVLQQSLKQWRLSPDVDGADGSAASPIEQRLNTLKEDYQVMLKQRFAAEDVNDAAGLVVEKPW